MLIKLFLNHLELKVSREVTKTSHEVFRVKKTQSDYRLQKDLSNLGQWATWDPPVKLTISSGQTCKSSTSCNLLLIMWNSLPETVVMATDLNSLKRGWVGLTDGRCVNIYNSSIIFRSP